MSLFAQQRNSIVKKAVFPALYVLGLVLVAQTLFVDHLNMGHHQLAYVSLTFALFMILGGLTTQERLRQLCALLSLAVLLASLLFYPKQHLPISDTYFLIPLGFLLLMRGFVWPVASSLVVLAICFPHNIEFYPRSFWEDALELIIITSFATLSISYRHRLHAQVLKFRQESITDFLTGVGNRKAFTELLEAINDRRDESGDYALLVLDIDNFKRLNDSLGHQAGDQLLTKLTDRLQQFPSAHQMCSSQVYRLSGDEFALVIGADYLDRTLVMPLVEELVKHCQQEYRVANSSYFTTISIGIALLSDAGNQVELWYRNADIAMFRAKLKGKNRIQWYDQLLNAEMIRHHKIEQELAFVLNKKQLSLYYQPKVDIQTNCIEHAEALIRWFHPQLGMITPAEFVNVAEKSQQIIPIGRWVVYTACKQAKAWFDEGRQVCIAVNVSTIQFLYDDIIELVANALKAYQLPPHLLQIEITETTLMTELSRVTQTCQKLRDMGVQIAIDDFGTAYSSLNYLKQLPIDMIKIDKSFVDECVHNKDSHMILRTIIQLGHNLGKKVIAEGVNSEAQLALLHQEECDLYQGYLCSQPLPANAFYQLVHQYPLGNSFA